MYTPLKKISLKELCTRQIMFDANVFMVGIENRTRDTNCSFENMKELYLVPLFETFENIIMHEMVYKELDEDSRELVDTYSKVKIVKEDGLYGVDPTYTTIFNNIAQHSRVKYDRRNSKDKGEVYSLAYAAFHKINYFSSKEIMVDDIVKEIEVLKDIHIITYDIIVMIAFLYHNSRGEKKHNKALKSIYKRYCEDVIKRHKLPKTLAEYIKESEDYIN